MPSFHPAPSPKSDPTAKSIFSKLLLHASQPYAEMLIDWMSSGQLTDNYKEFMVSASKDITKKQTENDATDQYWQDKYTVRPDPSFSHLSTSPPSHTLSVR